MLTFFQDTITSFDSKKIGPNFKADDGGDWLQIAEQKRGVLATQIERAKINPKLKDKFRRECNLVLDKDNPLERLHDLEESLRNYEEFVLGMRTSFLYERDGFISGELSGISFWGGRGVSFENETLPSEAITEKTFWLSEFIEPLYAEQTDPAKINSGELSATKGKMKSRIQKIKIEAEKRKKQIIDFLEVRKKNPSLAGRFKKLFSEDVFKRSTFEERRNILLRIGDQVRVTGGAIGFLELQEVDFVDELQAKIDSVVNLSDSEAWVILKNEEIKLRRPPRALRKLEVFKSWENKFRLARETSERAIGARLIEIKKNIADKKGEQVLQKDLEFVSSLNPQFKIEAKINPAPISLELKLLEVLGKNKEDKEDEPTSSIRENLFLAQKDNEFVRRMFIQIAALAMAMGQTSTANETQKRFVKKDLVARDSFDKTVAEDLRQSAVQKTTQQAQDAESLEHIDTLAAVQDSDAIQVRESETGLEAGIRGKEQFEFQTDSWEMTRLVGIKAWPPHELQYYLQTVRRSGHHLELTNNYLPVSFLFASNLLRQTVTANLSELPGQTAKTKELYRKELFNIIDSTQKADDGLVEKTFSYTPRG